MIPLSYSDGSIRCYALPPAGNSAQSLDEERFKPVAYGPVPEFYQRISIASDDTVMVGSPRPISLQYRYVCAYDSLFSPIVAQLSLWHCSLPSL